MGDNPNLNPNPEAQAQAQAEDPHEPANLPVAQPQAQVPPAPLVEWDDDGVVFHFGKEQVKIPPINFFLEKKHWDEIMGINVYDSESTTPIFIQRLDNIMGVLEKLLAHEAEEAGTHLVWTKDAIAKKIRAPQWSHITLCYTRLLALSGLIPDPDQPVAPPVGEAQGGVVEDENAAQASSSPSSKRLEDMAEKLGVTAPAATETGTGTEESSSMPHPTVPGPELTQ
jgi:hypothetical protein